ncbi:MAG TPA: cytochrome B5 [Caldithrix sp.]|nr:cytochrome B5 [Caldithrix sp.]
MKKFTKESLKSYSGKNGEPVYIAANGKVYDATNSFLWQKGKHMADHHAGQDLSPALKRAPHTAELLERLPLIGLLDEEK